MGDEAALDGVTESLEVVGVVHAAYLGAGVDFTLAVYDGGAGGADLVVFDGYRAGVDYHGSPRGGCDPCDGGTAFGGFAVGHWGLLSYGTRSVPTTIVCRTVWL